MGEGCIMGLVGSNRPRVQKNGTKRCVFRPESGVRKRQTALRSEKTARSGVIAAAGRPVAAEQVPAATRVFAGERTTTKTEQIMSKPVDAGR